MDWYVVVKTINGHRYRYRQKTWREGGRVRTRSEYLGPAGAEAAGPAAPSVDRRMAAEALAVLTEARADGGWDHAWSAEREGPSLVRLDARVPRLLKALGVAMTQGSDGAWYNPGTDVVNIPPKRCFMDKPGQSATSAYHIVLFHELVHWTHGRGRVERRSGGMWADPTWYAREELVAELGAVLLMRHLGLAIGNLERHALYFQTWLGRAGARRAALAHAGREAARAVRYILEHAEAAESTAHVGMVH